MSLKTANKFKELFLNAYVKSIDVFCHASPDEDTVNAAKVMSDWFIKNGKVIDNCVNGQKLKGLFIKKNEFDIKLGQQPYDRAAAFDFNTNSKIPKSFTELFDNHKPENIIGFDHHPRAKDRIKGNFYIDTTARSCCSIVYRFFEALGEKLEQKDLERLYCGMLSDYQKSKLVSIDNGKLIRLPYLEKDKNSKEVLEKIEAQLSAPQKAKIYKHLDILANLTPEEQAFRKSVFENVEVTPSGKIAYLVIKPNDKEWESLGMDGTRTSSILGDLRLRLMNGTKDDNMFSPEQKEKFKNLKAAIVFYQGGSAYQMSVHSKTSDLNSIKMIENAKKEWKKYLKETGKDIKWKGGGHVNRAGGRILSIDEHDTQAFVDCYLRGAEKTKAQEKDFLGSLKSIFI